MAEHNEKPKAKEVKMGPVTSDVGETAPPQVFGGDGTTPIEEWQEKYAAQLKENAEKDEKRRERAREDAGVIITTAKGK